MLVIYKDQQHKLPPEQKVFEINEKTGHVKEATLNQIKHPLLLKISAFILRKKLPVVWEVVEKPHHVALIAASHHKAVIKFRHVYSGTTLKAKIH